jgi:hypothetical protein
MKTIAEVIGIQYPHHCAACECDPWDSVVSSDEMLAWLQSHVSGLSINPKWATREWFVWVEIAGGDGHHEPRDVLLEDEFGAPTLSAAIELAVRAVDPFVQ